MGFYNSTVKEVPKHDNVVAHLHPVDHKREILRQLLGHEGNCFVGARVAV